MLELDILKVLAISAIVFCHLRFAIPQFSSSSAMTMLATYVGDFGFALFFFLAGYALMIKRPQFGSGKDVATFLKKRVVRLYPLYWLALAVLLLVQSYQLMEMGTWNVTIASDDPIQLIVYATGFQVLFENILISPATMVFWFVGAILVYYLLFPVIVYASGRLQGSRPRAILYAGLIVFLMLLAAGLLTGSVDERIYTFYWFFVGGMAMGGEVALTCLGTRTLLKTTVISGACLGALFVASRILASSAVPAKDVLITVVGQSGIVMLGIASVSLSILLVNKLRHRFVGRLRTVTERIAASTYAIYLFHLYVLLGVASIASAMGAWSVPVLVIIIGVPTVYVTLPILQWMTDEAVGKMLKPSS